MKPSSRTQQGHRPRPAGSFYTRFDNKISGRIRPYRRPANRRAKWLDAAAAARPSVWNVRVQ